MRSEFAGKRCWNSFFKENPDMSAVSGARAFQCGWHVETAARLKECHSVVLPVRAIEISCQEKTGFVLEHRIDAHNKLVTLLVLS